MQNLNTPFEKYSINVKNKNTWKLICENQSYFVSVSWDNYDWSSEIPSVTYLFEIKDFTNININYIKKRCISGD